MACHQEFMRVGVAGARPPQRQDVRALENPGAAGPGRDGAPRHLRVRTLSRTQITPVTLYRYVGPQGQLREQGEKSRAT